MTITREFWGAEGLIMVITKSINLKTWLIQSFYISLNLFLWLLLHQLTKYQGSFFFLYFLWMKVPKACCSSQLYLPSASQWFGLVHLQHMRFGWGTWTRKDASKENCDIVMWECESSLFGKWKALTNINFSWFPPHFPTSPSS